MNRQYINRPIYTECIKPFIGKQLIKVLTGQRRVGKSYTQTELVCENFKKQKLVNQ